MTTTTAIRDAETFESTQATVRRIAVESFANHALTEEGVQEWRCGRPQSGYYSFRVIVRPGTVIVWGDIGEGIFRGGEAGDTLAWLREAVYSPEYLCEKLRPARTEFYPGDALQWAREMAAEEGGRYRQWVTIRDEAEHLHECSELNGRTWAELVYEHDHDAECCSVGTTYHGETLWLVEALRWLVEHLPQPARAGTGGA